MNKRIHDTQSKIGLAFILPSLVLLLMTTYLPLAYAVWMSFNKGNGNHFVFNGINNYIALTSDEVFKTALVNSIIFTLVVVPSIFMFSVGVAVLLHQLHSDKIRSFFTSLLYLPCVTSSVVYSLFFRQVAYPDGILSNMLVDFGFVKEGFNIMQNEISAKIYISLICVWAWSGFYILILNSALQSTDRNLICAAQLDGASTSKVYRKIILSQNRPVLLLIILSSICSTFQIYSEAFLITNGGQGFSTSTLVLYLFNKTFTYVSDYGYSATIGIMIFTINLAISAVAVLIRSKKDEE